MGSVMMHAAVSVDGFIADDNDQVGPLFDYYGNGHVAPARPAQATRPVMPSGMESAR
ncbi:MAG TPA: hypothetical protein VE343_16440 [Streptosporangiaceae bacterium]|jgi:hypothetical protein|nr:hypothetical protein [Streptosporangiaceae bacterium]